MAGLTDDMAMLIERGGYVMIPLLALSVISLALIAERCWFWAALHTGARRARISHMNDALRRGDRPAAKRLADKDRSLYAALVRRMLDEGTGNSVAMEVVEEHRPRIDRFMVMLSTIITAAPLLGILGTVIGIIRSFNLLGEQRTLTDPRAVAEGIAEALLTTALGLVVALVTLFPYMAFRKQADRSLGRMESLIASAQEGLQRADRDTPSTVARGSAEAEGRPGREGSEGASKAREAEPAESRPAASTATRR